MEDRIETNKLIKNSILCQNCPAKIFQKDTDKIKYGHGNLIADYIFVLPISNYKNEDVYNHLDGICWNLINFDDVYITYHPKCKANSPVEVNVDFCKQFLFAEINKIKPRKILFFGIDIPIELANINIPCYKLNNLLSIYYDFNKLMIIRNQLINIIHDTP